MQIKRIDSNKSNQKEFPKVSSQGSKSQLNFHFKYGITKVQCVVPR